MMFKKAIIASAVLAASTGFAFANGGTYVAAPSCVHSCYVGVAVSRDFFSMNDNNNFSFHRHAVNDSVDLGNDGWDGEINAGLGWVFQDHYYLGTEIFGDASNTKINVGPVSFKNRYIYGIDLVPGVKISDSTMLYGKVGYVGGNFSVAATSFSQGWSYEASRTRNGLQLGLGLETMVTNNVSVKLEYDYNYFSKFNDTNVRPVVDQVKLGVAYHFMSA